MTVNDDMDMAVFVRLALAATIVFAAFVVAVPQPANAICVQPGTNCVAQGANGCTVGWTNVVGPVGYGGVACLSGLGGCTAKLLGTGVACVQIYPNGEPRTGCTVGVAVFLHANSPYEYFVC